MMILELLLVTVMLLGAPLWVVGVYNRLLTLRNLMESAWAQTDVQLRRRYDLIPNLVETAKGYAAHERETFEKVSQARDMAMNTPTPQAKTGPENALTGALKSLFVVAEAYPELKANQGFIALQEELTKTEGFIAACRSHFNDIVLTYNTALQVFPANLISGVFKFEPQEYFGVPPGAERETPGVQF